MPKATQPNLTLENKMGALANLCCDMAHAGVNFLALSAAESEEPSGSVLLLVANRVRSKVP